jgi:hypothetical protein
MRFEVFMAAKIWNVVFWIMTQCGLIGAYQCFREAYSLKMGGSRLHQNVGKHLPDLMES